MKKIIIVIFMVCNLSLYASGRVDTADYLVEMQELADEYFDVEFPVVILEDDLIAAPGASAYVLRVGNTVTELHMLKSYANKKFMFEKYLHEITHVYQITVLGYEKWDKMPRSEYDINIGKMSNGRVNPEMEAEIFAKYIMTGKYNFYIRREHKSIN